MASSFAPEIAADGAVVMENNLKYIHGRVDPGIEESIEMVEPVPMDQCQTRRAEQEVLGHATSSTDQSSLLQGSKSFLDIPDSQLLSRISLLDLPSELLDHILLYLSPVDLVSISATCHLLQELGNSDLAWYHHIQENVPGLKLTSPSPCATYRELYRAHDPHWFLTKYKLWFCDFHLTGTLILVRYDPRRGCIEGYRLVAERPIPTFKTWEYFDEVIIHSFEPQARLHMDQPVIQLDALSHESPLTTSLTSRQEHRFSAERPMRLAASNPRRIFSNFLLTRPVEAKPYMQVWPPLLIPARERVRNASQEQFVGSGHKPRKRSEVSHQAFRIRRWMEMSVGQAPGIHLGEEVFTYATLDPALYTPTAEKPYRGIWMGDFSGHGVEFLLFLQPEDRVPFDVSLVVRREDESLEEWEARVEEERQWRGSLEAIKLTGDPNVPRGELTFVCDEMGHDGHIRTVTEDTFKGARIVKSRGHIAARGFVNDRYIESQLILLSPDRVAQYWVGFGHINFYERVNIDSFLSPYNDHMNREPCQTPTSASVT